MQLLAPYRMREQVRIRPAHDPVTIFAMKSKEISSFGEDSGLNCSEFLGGCSGSLGSVQHGEQATGRFSLEPSFRFLSFPRVLAGKNRDCDTFSLPD